MVPLGVATINHGGPKDLEEGAMLWGTGAHQDVGYQKMARSLGDKRVASGKMRPTGGFIILNIRCGGKCRHSNTRCCPTSELLNISMCPPQS